MSTDKCPVCNWDLSSGVVEVIVNGRTIRVCCDECARRLAAQPEAYAPQNVAGGES